MAPRKSVKVTQATEKRSQTKKEAPKKAQSQNPVELKGHTASRKTVTDREPGLREYTETGAYTAEAIAIAEVYTAAGFECAPVSVKQSGADTGRDLRRIAGVMAALMEDSESGFSVWQTGGNMKLGMTLGGLDSTAGQGMALLAGLGGSGCQSAPMILAACYLFGIEEGIIKPRKGFASNVFVIDGQERVLLSREVKSQCSEVKADPNRTIPKCSETWQRIGAKALALWPIARRAGEAALLLQKGTATSGRVSDLLSAGIRDTLKRTSKVPVAVTRSLEERFGEETVREAEAKSKQKATK